MFIGHYGVSFAAKRYNARISLAVLFLAVQFLDVVFSVLVFAGVEKMRIIHGFTAFNPYDLYFMPYSHSLLGALAWSVVFAIGFLVVARRDAIARRLAAAAVLAAAVFSHFLLDIPMHTRDLPLGPGAGSPKIGLGLWNHPVAAIAAELAILLAGGFVYLRATRPRSRGAAVATVAFGLVLLALTVATPFMPDPPSARAFAIQALVSYALLALAAGAVDRRRTIIED
jgi:hypothetical protein